MNVLVPRTSPLAATFPAILQRAGKAACFAADEFFSARISNPHTRRADARPVGRFLTWCEAQGIELRQVTPGLAGRFIEELPGSDPTKNLARLGVLTYTGARVGALARLRRGDLQHQETQRVLRFREKGGKQREIPVRLWRRKGGVGANGSTDDGARGAADAQATTS